MRCRPAVALLAAVILSSPGISAESPSSRTLLALASRYVATFIERFSNVVAEERYVQDWKTSSGIALLHRELTSEFRLTRTSDASAWLALRDVFEVNGAPIRDRGDRLATLFLQAPLTPMLDQAAAIAAESARYNISNVQRTINHPLYVFLFLQAAIQPRFSFEVDKPDRTVGENVWIVPFKETGRPTLVRGTSNKDLPAHGRVWIDGATGRIAKTELVLEDRLQNAQITATFRHDEHFQVDVPVEMDEQYVVKGNAGKVLAKATYGRFRRFEVNTQESVK